MVSWRPFGEKNRSVIQWKKGRNLSNFALILGETSSSDSSVSHCHNHQIQERTAQTWRKFVIGRNHKLLLVSSNVAAET